MLTIRLFRLVARGTSPEVPVDDDDDEYMDDPEDEDDIWPTFIWIIDLQGKGFKNPPRNMRNSGSGIRSHLETPGLRISPDVRDPTEGGAGAV